MSRPRVLIIGAGPAGMFAADALAGDAEVTVIEQGRQIDSRRCPPGPRCECDPCSILEGTGGAGGLSDGKITLSLGRGTQKESIFSPEDQRHLDRIDQTVVKFAGLGVWYEPVEDSPYTEKFREVGLEFDSYPLRHVGSDGIQRYVKGHREDLIRRGVFIREEEVVQGLERDPQGPIVAWVWKRDQLFTVTEEYDYVVIAVGLAGTGWTESVLEGLSVDTMPGPAGFGMRLEAPAEVLAPLFETFYDFKIERDYPPIGSIRSFCCNQRGEVVNENHRDIGIRNVNGHSYLDPRRRTEFSNFAMIMKVGTDLSQWEGWTGMTPQEYVRKLARSINVRAGGTAIQSISSFMDYWADTAASGGYTNPKATPHNISKDLPEDIRDAYQDYLYRLTKVLPDLEEHGNIYAPEIKYYARKAPVERGAWSLPHGPNDRIYITGHATGYFDSYTASGITGIQAAEDIIRRERER